MGRPKAVVYKNFKDYNLLHTKLSKMYCGVSMTTLYPIKETPEFYRSIEVWAFCASHFKMKKKNGSLSVNIPEITDKKTIAFLADHCWGDWVDRQVADGESEMIETIAMLDKLFPNKKKVYFYEFQSLISAYCNGTFEAFNDDGSPKPMHENCITRQKYFNHKYEPCPNVPELQALYEKADAEKDKAKHEVLIKEYFNACKEYAFEHRNHMHEFIQIGRNSVCYPVAFSDGTADWHKEKYGKVCPYAHAGEIFFVVTPDAVYFETARHF